MYHVFRASLLRKQRLIASMDEQTITISVEKFKELLIYGWHLLSTEQQSELAKMGIHPSCVVIKK